MNRPLTSCLFAVAILLATVSFAAATVIDTTPANSTVGPFGEPNTATYGQTITAPLIDNGLTGFTFFFDDYVSPDFVDFQAFVYAWDNPNNRATGPALYASGPISSSNNGGAGGLETFAINTGLVALTPGAEYVLFFSASNLFDSFAGQASFAVRTDNPYAGGKFVYANNGNNFSQLTTTTWDGAIVGWDAAFQATFVPVPEPTTWILTLVGTMGACWLGRRHRVAR